MVGMGSLVYSVVFISVELSPLFSPKLQVSEDTDQDKLLGAVPLQVPSEALYMGTSPLFTQ